MTIRTLLVPMLLVLAGCGAADHGPVPTPQQPQPNPEAATLAPAPAPPPAPAPAPADAAAAIGVATMRDDGTIVLRLRAGGAGGINGEAVLTYPPDHSNYDEIRRHVGSLLPGETVPVAPWPAER